MARRTSVAGGTYTVPGLQRALRALPKEVQTELKAAAERIAQKVATDAGARARGQGGLSALVAGSLRASKGRTPAIRMGGATRLPASGAGWQRSRRGPGQGVGDAMWGAEFGGGRRSTTKQFLPWRGSGSSAGYFLYPTVRADSDFIADEYSEALLAALEAI